MVGSPWRGPLRAAAIVVGATLPLFTLGMVHADPGLPPLPDLPSSGGQPITIIVEPPSLWTAHVPVAPDGCAVDLSYDNTSANPAGTIFRGQTACGSEVYSPTITGQAQLSDIFGNVVADAPGYGARGNGPFTSQGAWWVTPATLPPSLNGSGPTPGLEYTNTYTTSMTITYPQYWGPAPGGCEVNGQTMRCTVQTSYFYIPGTQGGVTPS
jgi:hypothetical protein